MIMIKKFKNIFLDGLNDHNDLNIPKYIIYSNVISYIIIVYIILYTYIINNFKDNQMYITTLLFSFILNLFLCRNYIIEKYFVSIEKNKFGDIIVSLSLGKNTHISQNINELTHQEKQKAIYIGFIPDGATFIATHPDRGDIYGFGKTVDNFPLVYKSLIRGSACVVKFNFLGENWIILVKPKDRDYLMNPAGSINSSVNKNIIIDILHRNAAKCEVYEETGCVIDSNKLIKLAHWIAPRPYFNLKWKSCTYGYKIECDVSNIPNYITNVLNMYKGSAFTIPLPTCLEYDTNEISDIFVCKETMIESLIFDGIDIEKFRHNHSYSPSHNTNIKKINLTPHHGALVLKALNNYDDDNQNHKNLTKQSYLFEFNWLF